MQKSMNVSARIKKSALEFCHGDTPCLYDELGLAIPPLDNRIVMRVYAERCLPLKE
jgi:hypothetical protein